MNASSIVTIALTDPGEGLTEAEILEIKVAVGDRLEINAPVVEVETAKSAVELPSHVAGTVVEILVAVGDEVPVGAPLIRVDTAGGPAPADGDAPSDAAAPAGASSQAPAPSADGAADQNAAGQNAADENARAEADPSAEELAEQAAPAADAEPKNLVGYGDRSSAGAGPRRRRRRAEPAQESASGQVPIDRILAKPPVRKLARDLGIALHDVLATGPEGTVTRQDVLNAQQRAYGAETDGDYFPEESPQAPEHLHAVMKTTRDQPFSGVTSDERTTRVPIRSVRKRTAEAMVASAFTAPHVTVFNEIDMTGVMRIVSQLRSSREWADVKVSPLAVIAKALLVAIRRNPEVNASWDEDAQEIVYKHYVNLGIAAATPRGLVVPNIKDAHRLGLHDLALGLADLTATARSGKVTPRDMADGTITITNVGVFGIDTGTPILNPGEAAILAFGAIREQPWVHKGKIKVRHVTQLALSVDHRLVDGELGSRVLADVAAILADPAQALVWG
jgi:pyruvate dehydrogenase E2 component (dihydrolipoamide acetyltransferase)